VKQLLLFSYTFGMYMIGLYLIFFTPYPVTACESKAGRRRERYQRREMQENKKKNKRGERKKGREN
jgi:hypothetical protein